jgi:hypothetical protein
VANASSVYTTERRERAKENRRPIEQRTSSLYTLTALFFRPVQLFLLTGDILIADQSPGSLLLAAVAHTQSSLISQFLSSLYLFWLLCSLYSIAISTPLIDFNISWNMVALHRHNSPCVMSSPYTFIVDHTAKWLYSKVLCVYYVMLYNNRQKF